MTTEALSALMLWVLATGFVLGVAFSLFASLAVRAGQTFEILVGAASVAGASYLLARFDPMDLGGNIGWRIAVFAAALGAGYLAATAVIRRRPPVARIVVVARAAAAFAAAAAVVLVLCVAASFAVA